MKIFVREELINYSFAGDIDFFIKNLEEEVKKTGVPRDRVMINLDYRLSYEDSVDCFLTLEFEREETQQEKAERTKRAKRVENAERAHYERLKAKYRD